MKASSKLPVIWMIVCLLTFAVAGCAPKVKQWDSPPKMAIDPNRIYLAILRTEKGDIEIELFAERAPITVNNFIFLAKQGYYDKTTFHRVIPDFVAQGGDPTGTGAGGPGYRFEDEIDPHLSFDDEGYLAMANSGPNTNGSQFFITYAPLPHLNGLHTIFGKVVGGMEVVRALSPRNPAQGAASEGDQLLTVEIVETPESRLPADSAPTE